MELQVIPVMVSQPTGDVKYIGDTTFELPEKRNLLIRDKKGGESVEHFDQDVPDNKKWSVRVLLEITETNA